MPPKDKLIEGNEEGDDHAGHIVLTEWQRTPRKLKTMDPDVTVVVGGVEFHHYKAILCSGSDFFDTMLSTNMKESKQSRIELPDKDPNEWLVIYSFFDPTYYYPLNRKTKITEENALHYMECWFNYFGMTEHVRMCDKVYADSLPPPKTLDEFETHWNSVKGLPCPKTQSKVLVYLRTFFEAFQKPLETVPVRKNCQPVGFFQVASSYPPRNRLGGMTISHATKLKSMISDEVGGDKVWDFIRLKAGPFLPSCVAQLSHAEVAAMPLFAHLLQTCHKPLEFDE